MSAARSAPPSRSKMASSTTANCMAVDYRRLDRNFWSPVKLRGRSRAPPQRLYSKREEYEEDQRTDDEEQQLHPRTPLLQLTSFQGRARFPWNKNQFGPGFLPIVRFGSVADVWSVNPHVR